MIRAEMLDLARRVAYCATRAAETSADNDRSLDRLRECIRSNEREHRAMGARWTGGRARYAATFAQVVDYFVAKTLADAVLVYQCGAAPISALDGTREDYVRAAILMANADFRERFFAQLEREFGTGHRTLWRVKDEFDYCVLIGSEGGA